MKSLEKFGALLMLCYSTGAVVPFLGAHDGTQVSRAELAVQLPLYLIAFFFIAMHQRHFLEAATKLKWVIALTLIAVASTAWSQDPAFTLRRGIVLLATTAFGIYFGSRFDIDEQLKLLTWALAIVMCASVVFAIFLPQYGIDNSLHNGAWQGVFAQKNSLGRALVLTIMVFIAGRGRKSLVVVGVLMCLCLIVLSKSATSVLVLAALVCALPMLRVLRSRYTFALPIILFGFLIVAASTLSDRFSLSELLRLVHRDPSLTGRTLLWSAVLSAIGRQPWLGYGFQAFWLGGRGASSVIVEQLHWSPPHAHNGFLDLTLEIGLIGLAIFIIGYLLLWRQALRFLKREPGRKAMWLCMYLTFLLAYNFSERTILDQNSIFWILYVAVAVNLYLDAPVSIQVEMPEQEAVQPIAAIVAP
jgi:exopolysaccharide production protein ExoQ